MNYLSFLWSSRILHFIVAALIVFFFARRKDRDDSLGTTFDNQNWNLYDVLVCIFILDFSYIFAQFLKQWHLIQLVVFWALNFISFYFVFKIKRKESFSSLCLLKKGICSEVFYGLKIILVFNLFFYGWMQLSPKPERWLGWSLVYSDLSLYKDSIYALSFLLILFVLFAPFIEELIFRGLVYTPFRRKAGKWGAIFLSSTVFALYHGQVYNIFGFLFAFMYEKKRSLIPSIVAHSFFSTCQLITYVYLSDLFDFQYSIKYRDYAKIMFLACLLLLLAVLFVDKILSINRGRHNVTSFDG